MKDKFLSPKAMQRITRFAEERRPLPDAIRKQKANIKLHDSLCARAAREYGLNPQDSGFVQEGVRLRMELDALYVAWAEGNLH